MCVFVAVLCVFLYISKLACLSIRSALLHSPLSTRLRSIPTSISLFHHLFIFTSIDQRAFKIRYSEQQTVRVAYSTQIVQYETTRYEGDRNWQLGSRHWKRIEGGHLLLLLLLWFCGVSACRRVRTWTTTRILAVMSSHPVPLSLVFLMACFSFSVFHTPTPPHLNDVIITVIITHERAAAAAADKSHSSWPDLLFFNILHLDDHRRHFLSESRVFRTLHLLHSLHLLLLLLMRVTKLEVAMILQKKKRGSRVNWIISARR